MPRSPASSRRLAAVIAACGSLCLPDTAQTAPSSAAAPPSTEPFQVASTEPQKLESVVVKGQALRGAHAPFSSTAFDTDQIRDQQVSQPQEMFRWVPGMNVRNYGLGGVADVVTLRGFGGGAHGGDIGYVIDGIPLNEAMSHADGYADLNVVIPLEIDSLTVLRGPISPLYGNFNRAGVIVIDTRKTGAYRQGDFSLGSNTTGDAQVALGARLAPGQQLNIAAQAVTTEGFRPQSDAWRANLAGRWTMDVSGALQLALSGRLHNGRGRFSLLPDAGAVCRRSVRHRSARAQRRCGEELRHAARRPELSARPAAEAADLCLHHAAGLHPLLQPFGQRQPRRRLGAARRDL
jgi:iron complex outermembrane recepter protein